MPFVRHITTRARGGTLRPLRNADLNRLGELGILGAGVPPPLGGSGLDPTEALATIDDDDLRAVAAGHLAALQTLLAHATPEQAQRLVPPLAQGFELAGPTATPTRGPRPHVVVDAGPPPRIVRRDGVELLDP